MKPIVLILDGATGAGKSTVVELIKELEPSVRFGAKFTTRPRRATDGDWEFQFVDQIPVNHRRYAYRGVGWEYAINAIDLEQSLSSNSPYLISCTDPPTIRLLSQEYPTAVVYVYRKLSSADLLALMQERNTKPDDIKVRQEEVASALSMYAENMGLYDFVILNTGTVSDLRLQVAAMLREGDTTSSVKIRA